MFNGAAGNTEPPLPSFTTAAFRVKVVCVEGEVGAVCRSGFHHRCPRFKNEKPRCFYNKTTRLPTNLLFFHTHYKAISSQKQRKSGRKNKLCDAVRIGADVGQ